MSDFEKSRLIKTNDEPLAANCIENFFMGMRECKHRT
jgi:hypothetical protein